MCPSPPYPENLLWGRSRPKTIKVLLLPLITFSHFALMYFGTGSNNLPHPAPLVYLAELLLIAIFSSLERLLISTTFLILLVFLIILT